MIDYKDAVQLILDNTKNTKATIIKTTEALGKYSANDIYAPISVPSFDNSAMDGFGIRIAQITNATKTSPIILKNLGAIAAGDVGEFQDNGGTFHIMTGAKTPPWIEAVIPIENVVIENDNISFCEPASLGQNIRRIGDDVTKGDIIIQKNAYIGSEQIMLLASLGISEIEVFSPPKLHIISTGNELVPHDSGPLEMGKIYNSNAPFLLARAKEAGLEAIFGGALQDDPQEFKNLLQNGEPNQIYITTGAVSAGKWDFIPSSLKEIGANIHFHKVNIRPGKPILFATLPNGSIFFGLPGNPISSAIGFKFFVEIAIKALQGQTPKTPIKAKLENAFVKKHNMRQFVKAITKINDAGQFVVTIQHGQESFKISPMNQSNSWAVLPEDMQNFEAGQMLEIQLYENAYKGL